MSLRRNFLSRRIRNGSFSFSCGSMKDSRTLEFPGNRGNFLDKNVVVGRDDDGSAVQCRAAVLNGDVGLSPSPSPSPWSSMLPELLGEIIQRVETSEDKWPDRQSVVYCGCVCKQWRDVTKEVVANSSSRNHASSGKITFPSCLKKVQISYSFSCFSDRFSVKLMMAFFFFS